MDREEYYVDILEEYYECGDRIDKDLLIVSSDIATEATRNIMRNDFIKLFSYLSAVDEVISPKDVEFINLYFETEMTPNDLKDFINVNNTYSNTFENEIPTSFKRVVKYCAKGGQISNYLGDERGILEELRSFIEIFAKDETGRINKTINHAGTVYVESLFRYRNEFRKEFAATSQLEETAVSLKSLLNELNNLTGLSTVKQDLTSLIHLQTVKKLREKNNLKVPSISNHLVFYGNPGTGKTTVARLLAKIYKQVGILSKGQLVEVDRAGLIGGYVGQTALKVQNVVDSALGGVLFIDEAYSLSYSENQNDYGQEAIETLLKAMEDNRDDLVVIVAGYPDLMRKFIDSNPGLRSRFNKYIYFPDYNEIELDEIFNKMCRESDYILSEQADIKIKQILKQKSEQKDANFANAREARNLYETLIVAQADRIFGLKNPGKDILMKLEKIDVDNAQKLEEKRSSM